MWNLPAEIYIPWHASLVTAILFGWLLELNYLLYQNEADGVNFFLFDDLDTAWWGISLFTIVFQILYLYYLSKTLRFSTNWENAGQINLILMLLSQLTCMSNVYLNVSVSMFYWLSKLFIVLILIKLIIHWNQPMFWHKVEQEPQPPPAMLARGIFVIFIMVYYSVAFLVDVLFLNTIFSLSYLSSFVGDWCTSLIIYVGLGKMFSFTLRLLILLIRFIVTGSAKVPFHLLVGFTWFQDNGPLIYFEADMSTCLKYMMLSQVYNEISLVGRMIHEQWLNVLDSRKTHEPQAYLRVFVFTAIVTIIPTLLTVNLAAHIQVNVWLLLIASGNASILWQAFGTFLEVLITVFAPNSTERDIERRDDIFYYVRLVKSLVQAVEYGMHSYIQLLLPCFQGVFYVRIFYVLCDVIQMFLSILGDLFVTYHKKNIKKELGKFIEIVTKQAQEPLLPLTTEQF